MTAKTIIEAVRSRGSDAVELRDAAHEASHALEAGARRWDRESIHRALLRKFGIGALVSSEVHARAVEQLVCAELGVGCETIEACAGTAILEAAVSGLPMITDHAMMVRAVRNRMTSKRAMETARRILELEPAPRRRKETR